MEKQPTAKGGSADNLAEMSTVPCKFTEEDDEILPEMVAVDADKDSVNKLKAEKEVAEVILAEKVAHKLLFEVASGKDGKEATISSKRKREELMPDKVCNLNVDLVASFVNKLKVNKEGAFFNKLKVGKEANFSKQPWYMSPETGAHAAGAWGPGQWSSSSPSMPRSGGRYIDTWGKEHGPEDLFVQSTTWFTDENGLRQYLVHFERADQAIIDTAMKPGSQITLETKTHVMTYWRSPSSQSLCMNIGEDLMEFGKRSHWSVVNLGTEITPDNYFLKMELQGRYAEFLNLQEEMKATGLYMPFAVLFDKVKKKFPDVSNLELVMHYDHFQEFGSSPPLGRRI